MALTEFELINKYFTRPSLRSDIVRGIGDDCAILSISQNMDLAVTIDTLVSGIHFPTTAEPHAIGWKSLAVSLSDLAAMGADPAWITLALTLPEINEYWLNEFRRGLFELADQYNVALIGGDTTRGPLTITIEAHGLIPSGQMLTRNGAQPEDIIYVTGTLGDAALGLAIYEDSWNELVNDTDRNYLIKRLNYPQPQVAVGIALRGIANAIIDISDGLVADLGHILNSSSLGAIVYLECLPRSLALKNLTVVPWDKIIGGGDDYELCFTVPAQRQSALEAILTKFNYHFTPIGVITPALGIVWRNSNNQNTNFHTKGYRHF